MRAIAYALAGLILASGTACAADITVTMKGMQFQPGKIAAKRGDVLVLTNDDTVDHDALVTTFGYGVNPGNIKPGETKRIALMKRGKFEIQCVYHDTMTIAVSVK
ncbi:MAG TPA: cupredoxin domain-containing protein [Stellaceae bacterium]|nr:cupredoxin domain-containing protein [Stellaceae bacterium]